MDVIEASLAGTAPDWEHPSPAVVASLTGCPQTSTHHGEGDVATHTRMTWELACETAQARGYDDRRAGLLRTAALLHDIGKPEATVGAMARLFRLPTPDECASLTVLRPDLTGAAR